MCKSRELGTGQCNKPWLALQMPSSAWAGKHECNGYSHNSVSAVGVAPLMCRSQEASSPSRRASRELPPQLSLPQVAPFGTSHSSAVGSSLLHTLLLGTPVCAQYWSANPVAWSVKPPSLQTWGAVWLPCVTSTITCCALFQSLQHSCLPHSAWRALSSMYNCSNPKMFKQRKTEKVTQTRSKKMKEERRRASKQARQQARTR